MEIKKSKTPSSSSSIDSGAADQPSFRVYYGATGAAVPFKWESQPGTPKHSLFSDGSSLPPLTPPPAYFSAPSTPSPTPKKKKSRILRRSSPHSHSSSSSSSSSSMYSSPSRKGRSALTCFGLSCGYPVSTVKNALFSVVACRRSHSVDYIV